MSHHHHHHDPPPPAACCGCGCGCSAPAPPCGYYPAPLPQPASGSDHLLHAIAAHLLLNSGAPPPSPQQHLQPQPQAPPPAPHHANLYSYAAYQSQYQQAPAPPLHHHHQQQQQTNPPGPDHGQLLLHSLLRRVAALETTLPGCFPSPPPPLHPNHHHPRPQHRASAAHQEEAPPSPPPPPRRRRGPSEAELAARTIQEHFRRFLARRSRTLRQLKELAILRSKAASLRGSLSGRRRCADPAVVTESVMRLLQHLEGIQGGDPMIREGKHAVSRELCRILEFVNKVLVKDHHENKDEYPEGCNGPPGLNRPTVNKKVSFHCNGAEKEANESSDSSSSAEADERKGKDSKKTDNGKPGLAAPVPVHMEDF